MRVASPGWPGHATRGRSFSYCIPFKPIESTSASQVDNAIQHNTGSAWMEISSRRRSRASSLQTWPFPIISTQETEARERRAPRDVISFVKAWRRRNTSYLIPLPGIIETFLHARVPPRYSLALTAGKSHVIMLRSATLDPQESTNLQLFVQHPLHSRCLACHDKHPQDNVSAVPS